ncbi:MAG: diacylglycerol kinase family protein [Dysgonomonas sp.]
MEDYKKSEFSFKERLMSFKYAFSGLKILFSKEHNAHIHLIITIITIVMGVLFSISSVEWLVVLVLIALVFSLEIINSAIEHLCNFISPEWHKTIKNIKDLSAAAVLVAAVMAVICGIIIFIPKLCDFFGHSCN